MVYSARSDHKFFTKEGHVANQPFLRLSLVAKSPGHPKLVSKKLLPSLRVGILWAVRANECFWDDLI